MYPCGATSVFTNVNGEFPLYNTTRPAVVDATLAKVVLNFLAPTLIALLFSMA